VIKHVQVETTSVCNAHCVFCPHERLVHVGHMEQTLYEKIVRDAAQYDLETFTPMLTGEPFCDPQILPRLRLAREVLKPETTIRLFTNGSLMSYQDIEEMATIDNLSIIVSLNGACTETRQRMMGLDDFEEVRAKVYYLKDKGIRVETSMVWHPTIPIEECQVFAKFPNPHLIQFQSFAGHTYSYRRNRGTCRRIGSYLTIQRDGTVCLCCFDAFDDVEFGDLKTQTIAEVLESGERQMYVKANEQGKLNELHLCSECTEGDS